MEVDRIKFERTGGFANMRLTADLEMHDLPKEQADSLKELLDDLDFPELPEKLIGKDPIPDDFIYIITVEAEKWQHTVTTGGTTADEKMQQLIQMLNRMARKQLKRQ